MNKLSILIPVYFSADTLELMYQNLVSEVLPKLQSYEIVMIDDGSGDNSWEVMQKIAKQDSNVKCIKLSRNFGSHAAILAGLNHCTGDCATIKAADMQEPSSIILEMFESWKKGNKVVLAARSDRDESFTQKLFSNTYYYLMRKFAMKSMPKGGFDCFLVDRKVIEALKLFDEKNSALTLQILWAGFKTDTIYYVRLKREIGTSKWTLSKKIKLVVDSMISFSFIPIRFISITGVLFSFISFLWAIWLILGRLFGGIAVEGWTTLMVMVLFTSGMIMLTLGILGEYIWRAFDAARNRPPYIIDEIE